LHAYAAGLLAGEIAVIVEGNLGRYLFNDRGLLGVIPWQGREVAKFARDQAVTPSAKQ
jgi:hypothetical protein